jgi:hypothetical protein
MGTRCNETRDFVCREAERKKADRSPHHNTTVRFPPLLQSRASFRPLLGNHFWVPFWAPFWIPFWVLFWIPVLEPVLDLESAIPF